MKMKHVEQLNELRSSINSTSDGIFPKEGHKEWNGLTFLCGLATSKIVLGV